MSATKKNEAAAQEEQKIMLPPPKAEEVKEMRNPNIAIYKAYLEACDILGEEEGLVLFKNLFKYYGDEELIKMSRQGQAFMELIKLIIDKDDLIWLYEQKEKHRMEQEARKAEENGDNV